ncbi:MAG TPA: ABC transporter permease [Candidatus Cybelea sp.]|nr:ABC transporter permease [Candidatus Cybelea sp.]
MRPEKWLYTFPLRVRSLLEPGRVDQELDDELRYHIERRTEENIARGMAPEAARRDALLELRGLERTKQECQDVLPLRWLDHVRRDVRYALRMLAKNPAFTSVAVTALALGIGADTAMYTIAQGALCWDLGLDNPNEIVAVTSTSAAHGEQWSTSYPDFRDYRTRVKSLMGLAAYEFEPANLTDGSALPERYDCVRMSANGFSLIGQRPLLGRTFIAGDEKPGARAVVILGYHVWRDRYGGDRAIVGKAITIDEIPHTVIGVMPPGRRFPEETDLWVPLVPDAARERRESRSLMLFGRLRKGVPLASVRAEMTSLAGALAAQYPNTNKGITAVVMPVKQLYGLYYMEPLFLELFVAVGFVLLIACADVANMLLARATERAREISIRVAIGAGKAAILRQLLVESVGLSLSGGVLGWVVAKAGLRWFQSGVSVIPKPEWLHLSLDRGALVYLSAISVATGILFGLAPALRLAKSDVHAALKQAGGLVPGKPSLRLSHVLVGMQTALCVVLLAGAGLMVRSAVKLYSAPVGVRTAGVLTMQVNLPEAKYATEESWVAFHSELAKRLGSLPGVGLSGLASNLPLSGWIPFAFEFEGRSVNPIDRPEAGGLVVSTDYFELMQVRPLRGRLFLDTDGKSGPPAVIVNQSFAAKFWPLRDVLGGRLRIVDEHSAGTWLTVVGVVPDILQNFPQNLERDPLIYLPFAQRPDRRTLLMVRTSVPPQTVTDAIRREVQKMDAGLPLYDVRTLDEHIAQNRLTVNLFGGICSVFAGIATVLAATGLYAVIAHAVNRRRQEIGLRFALGATRRDIARLVFGQGIRPLVPGLVAGLALALGLTRLLRTLLVGVSPTDPATFAGAVSVLIAAALVGCAVPARRAMRVDPIVALRQE